MKKMFLVCLFETILLLNTGCSVSALIENISSKLQEESDLIGSVQTLDIEAEKATSITLSASGGESGASLSYTIETLPAHGVLTGAPPDMIYTPANGYVGADSFSFKVSDGTFESQEAIVSLTVVKPVLYLRSVTDSPAGDDTTAVFNNPLYPYATAQAAVAAAQSKSLTLPMVIDVGVGSFGHVNLAGSDLVHNISWRGVSVSQSIIGNINGDGANGTDGFDDHMGSVVIIPTPGENGNEIKIQSESNVKFGNITARGGLGGADGGYDLGCMGNGGRGGIVTIGANVDVNNVDVSGGGGNTCDGATGYSVPGSAGSIDVYGKTAIAYARGAASPGNGSSGGTVNIRTGAQVASVDTSGAYASYGNGGDGGTVLVEVGATVGTIDTSGKAGYTGYSTGGISSSGRGGTVIVWGTVTGTITAVGGDDSSDEAAPGDGGAVTVEASGVVNGLITSRSGFASWMSLISATSGTVIVKGQTASIDVSGGVGYTESGIGGAVTVTAAGIVNGSINASGGAGELAGARGGILNIAGRVTGLINANGGIGDRAGNGGSVTVLTGASVLDIRAIGGEGINITAGNGGLITIQSGAIARDLSVRGGSTSVSGSASGSGGSVDVQAFSTSGNVDVSCGDALDVPPGSSGTVNVDAAAISYYAPTPINIVY